MIDVHTKAPFVYIFILIRLYKFVNVLAHQNVAKWIHHEEILRKVPGLPIYTPENGVFLCSIDQFLGRPRGLPMNSSISFGYLGGKISNLSLCMFYFPGQAGENMSISLPPMWFRRASCSDGLSRLAPGLPELFAGRMVHGSVPLPGRVHSRSALV